MNRLTRRQFGGALAGAAALAVTVRSAAAAEPVLIEIDRFKFVPDDTTIRAGDTVEWVNHDLAPHTATDNEGGWDTGKLDRNGRARLRFDQPGAYSYHCAYHPNMRGRITVRNAEDK